MQKPASPNAKTEESKKKKKKLKIAIHATYSAAKQPEGGMNQQESYLSCSKQAIHTKHRSEVIGLYNRRELAAAAQEDIPRFPS